MCTYCGALLFPKETRDAKTRGWYETDCCGAGLCCSRGKVDLPPVARDNTIELLWEDKDTRTTLVKHARQLTAMSYTRVDTKFEVPPRMRPGWAPHDESVPQA